MTMLKGIGASRGYGSGVALVKHPVRPVVEKRAITDAAAEVERLYHALDVYSGRLHRLAQISRESVGSVAVEIFNAYRTIARDKDFIDMVCARVMEEKICADYVLLDESQRFVEHFNAIADDYLRERATDVENITNDVISILTGTDIRLEERAPGKRNCIIVAENLTPEEMLRLESMSLRGIITQHGGATAHTVILAKALGIPAIVGVSAATERIREGDRVLVDAFRGEVCVNPDRTTARGHTKLERAYRDDLRRGLEAASRPAVTLDGSVVSVTVNTGDRASLRAFSPEYCDGIGLFRTEFVYLDALSVPSEQDQFKIYRDVVRRAKGKEVIFRTVDTGGDKNPSYMRLPKEENPLMGYRALRVCLENPAIFGAQLRAILRASAYGRVKLMFPMVVTLGEFRAAKSCLENEKQNLRERQIPFDENIPVGMMIETPAAVMLSDMFAREADFFSVGTNDLIQYVTASDRMNERVHSLFDPCSPAILRLMTILAENAAAAGIPWCICGESAAEEKLIPLWVALGVSQLSVTPGAVGSVKRIVGALDRETAREWLQTVLRMDSGTEVNAYMDNILNAIVLRQLMHGIA